MKYRITKRRKAKNHTRADLAATILMIGAAIVVYDLVDPVVSGLFLLAAVVATARLFRQ